MGAITRGWLNALPKCEAEPSPGAAAMHAAGPPPLEQLGTLLMALMLMQLLIAGSPASFCSPKVMPPPTLAAPPIRLGPTDSYPVGLEREGGESSE